MSEPAICDPEFPVIRLGSPADLVDAVPYLLGFHPSDSVVLIAVRGQRRRIGLTLRLDLPALAAGPEPLANCLHHLRQADAEGLLIAIYARTAPDPGEPLPEAETVLQVADAVAEAGIELVEAVLVAEGRWWSYLCSNPMCCPPEGQPVSGPAAPSAVMAAATVAGMSAAADRDEAASSLLPLPRPQRRRLAAQVKREAARWDGPDRDERAQEAVRRWRSAILAQEAAQSVLSNADAALLLVGLADVAVRDECCAAVREQHRGAAFRLARQLARRAVHPWDVAPYTLTSWLAWLEGNGMLSRVAIDRALVSDPDYRLGLLMEQLLDCGVDPAGWGPMSG
jgi:uncharacterized protein DUF4192